MNLECGKCKKTLPTSKFSKKRSSKRGYSSNCKDCHNEYMRTQWYPKNKDRHIQSVGAWKEKNRIKMISYQYASTEEEVARILSIGQCEICGSSDRLVVDHDHKTNKVRGRLCHGCNVGIGFFNEDVDSLKAAVIYLSNKA